MTNKADGGGVVRCSGQVERLGERAIVRLPPTASAELPTQGQVAAVIRLNGTDSRQQVVEPDGRRGHWLSIDPELASERGIAPGDPVAIEIEPSKQWPEPELPQDFSSALDDADDLTALWRDITPMARWEWVRWIGATKNPDTRARRVEAGIDKLRSGKRRPCCFDRSSCTDPEVAKSGKLIDPS